jgi:hypothetical protein
MRRQGMIAPPVRWGIAALLVLAGSWCVIWPASVVAIGFPPQYHFVEIKLAEITAWFGLKALLSALFVTQLRRCGRPMLAIVAAVALLFSAAEIALLWLTQLLWLDLLSNAVLIGLCAAEWRAAPREFFSK